MTSKLPEAKKNNIEASRSKEKNIDDRNQGKSEWEQLIPKFNAYMKLHLVGAAHRPSSLTTRPNYIKNWLLGKGRPAGSTGSNQQPAWVALFWKMHGEWKAPSTGSGLAELGTYGESMAPPPLEILQAMNAPRSMLEAAQKHYSSPSIAGEAASGLVSSASGKKVPATPRSKLNTPVKLFHNDAPGASQPWSDATEGLIHRFLVDAGVLDSAVEDIAPESFQEVYDQYCAERQKAPVGSVTLPARSLLDITAQCKFVVDVLAKGRRPHVGQDISDDAEGEIDQPDEFGQTPSDASTLHHAKCAEIDSAANLGGSPSAKGGKRGRPSDDPADSAAQKIARAVAKKAATKATKDAKQATGASRVKAATDELGTDNAPPTKLSRDLKMLVSAGDTRHGQFMQNFVNSGLTLRPPLGLEFRPHVP
ncbi:hypothetical protein T484DRAFT_3632503 [Baffinella frigidus]|nr:hypothetical protein T484DRAFT_3632503 [Cryptophyta sp. CCMP2293]